MENQVVCPLPQSQPSSPQSPNGTARRGRRRSSSISALFEDNVKMDLPACLQHQQSTGRLVLPDALRSPITSPPCGRVDAGADPTTGATLVPANHQHHASSLLHSHILHMYLANIALRQATPPDAPTSTPAVTCTGGDRDSRTTRELLEAARRLETEGYKRRNGSGLSSTPRCLTPTGRFDLARVYSQSTEDSRHTTLPPSTVTGEDAFYSLPDCSKERRRKNRENNVMAPVSF